MTTQIILHRQPLVIVFTSHIQQISTACKDSSYQYDNNFIPQDCSTWPDPLSLYKTVWLVRLSHAGPPLPSSSEDDQECGFGGPSSKHDSHGSSDEFEREMNSEVMAVLKLMTSPAALQASTTPSISAVKKQSGMLITSVPSSLHSGGNKKGKLSLVPRLLFT